MRLAAPLALAALSCVLAGCPGTARREIETLPIASELTGNTGRRAMAGNWWEELGDSQLDRYIGEALDSSFSLAATRARLAKARADGRVTNGGTLPSITADLDVAERTSAGNVPGFFVEGVIWSAGIAASYELDLWGRNRAAKRGAAATVRAAEYDLDAAAISLSAEVAIAWYRWVEASLQYELRREQTETSTQILSLVEARYARGQVSAQDVFRQRQVVEAARQAEVASSSDGMRWRSRLAALLARPPGELALPAGIDLPELQALPAVGAPVEIIKQRPDLRASYQRLLAADANAASALAERYPRLSISATATTSSQSVSTLFQNWLLSLAGNLLTPLFDGGVLKARADSAASAAQAAWFDYAQAALTAVAEIESALISDAELTQQVASLARQVELADRALLVARAGYTSGQSTYLQTLDAVLALQGLQRDLLQSRRDAILARVTLHRAVAGPLTLDDQGRNE